MTLTTYGALSQKLIEAGYVPTSALRVGADGWRAADDPAAVVCIPQHGGNCGVADGGRRTLIILNVLARDAKLRAALASTLAKHGISGPVRTDSAGNDAYVVRWDDDYRPPHSEDIEVSAGVPAFAVGGWTRDPSPRAQHGSAIIRCDGEWRGGDLLNTPRAKLPGIEDEETLKRIVSEVRDVIAKNRPEAVADPAMNDWSKPSDPRWKPYEPIQPGRATNLTAEEKAKFVHGARSAISHREKARLDRLAANGSAAED